MNDTEIIGAKRKWTAEERQNLADGKIDGGFAGPDQSYPIAGPGDVGDAWGLAGQASDPEQIRKNIIRICRKFGWMGSLPDTAKQWMKDNGMPMKMSVIPIKADDAGEWELHVLGNPYGGHNGGKDSDGEFFSSRTKFHEDKFFLPPAVYYHGYSDDGRPSGSPEYIGKAVSREVRNDGVWYRVILNKASQYARRVWEAAKQGVARASSGSVAHLVRKAKDGEILEWPVAELSIFDAVGNRQPANQYAVALPVLKAVYQAAGLPLPVDIQPESSQSEGGAKGEPGQAAQSATSTNGKPDVKSDNRSSGVTNMNEQELKALIAAQLAEAKKAEKEEAEAERKRKEDEQTRIDAAVKAEREKNEAEIKAAKDEAAAARRPLGGGDEAPYIAKFANLAKYDDLAPADLAFAYGVLKSAKRGGHSQEGPSEDLRKALAIGLVEDKNKDGEYTAAKRQMAKDLKGVALKANELNQSTLATFGDEWIGVTYSNALWRMIILPTSIPGRIPTLTVPQGSESVIIPVQSAPPTFYKVAQATAQGANPGAITETVTTSKMSTTAQTLSVAKLGAASQYTGELEEDSFIPWAAELRSAMTMEAQAVLEHIIIDGDTATGATTNINDIGGTPAGTEPFLLFNGFRKLALVTNTANSRDAGSLGVDDYLETVKLMGVGGTNAVDQNAVSFIISLPTSWATLNVTEVKNQDFTRAALTMDSGRLARIWGYEIITSPYMHRANQDATYGLKANTAGKTDLDTAANNTTGAILAVRFDQWRLGYKRQITFEIERFPRADATSVVAMMRVGLVYRDTEASSISYNVTV